MKPDTIGRNQPCPCGSGKKYKKCCLGETQKLDGSDLLPKYDEIDYGEPRLDEYFFRVNTLHQISAYRLLYSCLLMPDVENVAEQLSRKFIKRGQDELEVIESTTDVNTLIGIVANSPDSLNHPQLVKRVLQFKVQTIPILLAELKRPQKDDFIEIAIKVIHLSGNNYSNELLDIIKSYQRNAYAVSQLCMLLGFYKNNETEKVLWNHYHFFKEHFKNETFRDGPLLGLLEMRADAHEYHV